MNRQLLSSIPSFLGSLVSVKILRETSLVSRLRRVIALFRRFLVAAHHSSKCLHVPGKTHVKSILRLNQEKWDYLALRASRAL